MSPPPVSLPSFAAPNRVVVGAAPPVPVYGADAPRRPVLCLQPMTVGDARYQEGRRAGMLEAAALVKAAGAELPPSGAVSRMLCLCYEAAAGLITMRAGEP